MRNLPTPEPHVLKRNLDNLVKRWNGTPNKENQQQNFQRVGKHESMLRKAAFWNQSWTRDRVQRPLHQTLNKSLLCGATTIGPKIAIAVLSLIFYGINCKKKGSRHDGNAQVIPFIPQSNSVHTTSLKEDLFWGFCLFVTLSCSSVICVLTLTL